MDPNDVIKAARGTLKRLDDSIATERKKIVECKKRSIWYRMRPNKPTDEEFAEELDSCGIFSDYFLVGYRAFGARYTCEKMIALAEAALKSGTTVHVSAEDWDDIKSKNARDDTPCIVF
jgi:hypothetical protein